MSGPDATDDGSEIDATLTTYIDGTEAEGELDVGYDGLERDYSARVPAIESLMRGGTMRERAIACWTLASWAQPPALRELREWVQRPEAAPWGDSPPAVGDEGVYAFLLDALDNAGRALQRTDESDRLRVEVLHAALDKYDQLVFASSIANTLLVDRELIDELQADIAPAIERALAASRPPAQPELRRQAAALLGVLVTFDEPRAAQLAKTIRETFPVNDALLVALAVALSDARGAETRALLEDLAASSWKKASARAKEALAWRARL